MDSRLGAFQDERVASVFSMDVIEVSSGSCCFLLRSVAGLASCHVVLLHILKYVQNYRRHGAPPKPFELTCKKASGILFVYHRHLPVFWPPKHPRPWGGLPAALRRRWFGRATTAEGRGLSPKWCFVFIQSHFPQDGPRPKPIVSSRPQELECDKE